MKEWRKVTFMKEWVKPLCIGYHQALELPKNLIPSLRTSHLKIFLGPTKFYIANFMVCESSYFIPISTMAPNSSAEHYLDIINISEYYLDNT